MHVIYYLIVFVSYSVSSLLLTGERNPSGAGIPMLSAHHTAGTLSGIHSFHLGNMFLVRCLPSLQARGEGKGRVSR